MANLHHHFYIIITQSVYGINGIFVVHEFHHFHQVLKVPPKILHFSATFFLSKIYHVSKRMRPDLIVISLHRRGNWIMGRADKSFLKKTP